MTDHLNYDQLLERGRELFAMVENDFGPLAPRYYYYGDDISIALALLKRHLARQVVTIVPLDRCYCCGALQKYGREVPHANVMVIETGDA